jgi:Trk K+ transport system NAD-binding subunit
MVVEPGPSRVFFIVLRFMRAPILTLMAVYAVSMLGWVLIPGIEEDGAPSHMTFFHAFYFLAYTATTTGFGEIPHAFSDTQRMWATLSLYVSVLAWLYAVGSIIRLLQNPFFQQALAERRFVRRVARIGEPFFILCGFGDTGSLLTRGLTDAGRAVVVLDRDAERIKALALRDYPLAVPGLCGDVRVPEHLVRAGLHRPNCQGVIALTPDEEVNLKVAVTARLLHPDTTIVVRSTSPQHAATLATLGGDIHIVDPFKTYARYLATTIHSPVFHQLSQWLIGAREASLDRRLAVPKGKWILCGYGRMGRQLREALDAIGASTVVIDPALPEAEEGATMLRDDAHRGSLAKAGIEDAAGIIIGTDSDGDNLSILLNAKALRPGIFTVVRQNRHRNEMLFAAARADLIMQPSLVAARRILFQLTVPLLRTFLEQFHDPDLAAKGPRIAGAFAALRSAVGTARPRLWTMSLLPGTALALDELRHEGVEVTLDQLLRHPADRSRKLDVVALVLETRADREVMPPRATPLRIGDCLLLCGTLADLRLVESSLNNPFTLRYLVSGRDEPRGWLMRRLARPAAPAPRPG